MAYFNLPFGVRIADDSPIDGDRYIAATIVVRDALVTSGRAKAGQQVFVEADQTLYILKGNTNSDWEEVGSGAGGDANYIHTQSTPLPQWSITHNLGKRPSVQIANSAGALVEAEITHINDNSITVDFNVSMTGVAIIN